MSETTQLSGFTVCFRPSSAIPGSSLPAGPVSVAFTDSSFFALTSGMGCCWA